MVKHLFIMATVMYLAVGCATREYVHQEIEKSQEYAGQQISKSIEAKVGKISQDIMAEIKELKNSVAVVSNNVQDAMDRAEKAGKLAEGKFLYEATISDASINFAFDRANLSEEALKALDVIAGNMIKANKNAYLEIQGHTDSTGSEEYNLKLGMDRAESVLRYFHIEHQIPLHRMNAFSYGETRMAADNNSSENRAQNRRVTIVVME